MPEGKEKPKHSVKVPQLYKVATRILQRYENKEGSLKTLVYGSKCRDLRVTYGLLSKCIDNSASVKTAIAVSNLLIDQPRFDPHLAQILTTQLLVKGSVSGNCKPILIFKDYEEKIKAAAQSGFNIDQEKAKDALPRYVRVNTLLGGMDLVHVQLETDGYTLQTYDPNVVSYDEYLQLVKNLSAPNYLIDYHIGDLLVFPSDTHFWESVLYKKGVVVLQDKASCLPVFLSSISERCNVIDACAAPGNKTCNMAATMNNKGKIIAVERDQARFKTLRNFIRKRQATCVTAINRDFLSLDRTDHCDIEYIFVDPSCSSSGTKVHDDEVSRQRVGNLAVVQVKLLTYALSFPSVKEVIYSTCSIYEEENEKVVEEALRTQKNFKLANLGEQLQGWKHFGHPNFEFGNKCLRTDVDIDRCTGFFVAKFVRKDGNEMKKAKCGKKKRKSCESPPSVEMVEKKKKNKKQKVTQDNSVIGEDTELEGQSEEDGLNSLGTTEKKKKKKKQKVLEDNSVVGEDTDMNLQVIEDGENLSTVEVTEKKKKKKKKKLSTDNTVAGEDTHMDLQIIADGEEVADKKKKRKKQKL